MASNDFLTDVNNLVATLKRRANIDLSPYFSSAASAADAQSAALTFTAPSPSELALAIESSDDPSTDPEVSRLLQLRTLGDPILQGYLDAHATRLREAAYRSALSKNLDKMLKQLSDAAAVEVAHLEAAYAAFGPGAALLPSEAGLYMTQGPTAAATFAAALQAVTNLAALTAADNGALAYLVRLSGLPSSRLPVALSSDAEAVHSLPYSSTAWTAVQRGIKVSLPTSAADYRSRVEAVSAVERAALAAAEAERAAAQGRQGHMSIH